MTLIDEFTRECLAIRVARQINSLGFLETTAPSGLHYVGPGQIEVETQVLENRYSIRCAR